MKDAIAGIDNPFIDVGKSTAFFDEDSCQIATVFPFAIAFCFDLYFFVEDFLSYSISADKALRPLGTSQFGRIDPEQTKLLFELNKKAEIDLCCDGISVVYICNMGFVIIE